MADHVEHTLVGLVIVSVLLYVLVLTMLLVTVPKLLLASLAILVVLFVVSWFVGLVVGTYFA